MATWEGQSGRTYEFEVRDIPHNPPPGGGNYIFVRRERDDRGRDVWHPLYIGETGHFVERFQNHEKLPCAQNLNMNQVHYHVHNGSAQVRRAEERDLIQRWNPPCND